MNENSEFSKEEIEDLLKKAIKKLQKNDYLFLDPEFDINERTVTHRLGMYLNELFPDYNVDCEYNRMYDEKTKSFISKRVNLHIIENEMKLDDTDAKTVFPDIIIHKRQTKENLLAIEIKMGWKNKNIKFDIAKAETYKKELGYKHSVSVIVGPEKNYEINWIENE